MRESLRSYLLRENLDRLLAEWDGEKNAPLTPDAISYGSKRLVWWTCENGHRWTASPCSRKNGAGCPLCAERKPPSSLAAAYPRIAGEWHPAKNGARTPENTRPNSVQRVWWRCERGHEWRAEVSERVSGLGGCPVCRGRRAAPGENDLASRFPNLAREWAAENGSAAPADLPYTSARRVWWRCGEGHLYRARIADRASGAGCPYCGGRKEWRPRETPAPMPVRAARPAREDRPAV